MTFKSVRVKPEFQKELIELAEKEGRHIYKMLEIILEEYKRNRLGEKNV